MTGLDWILVIAVSLLSAALAVLALGGRRPVAPAPTQPAVDPAWLFDGETLLDATEPARRLLTPHPEGSDWARLKAALAAYPDLPDDPAALSRHLPARFRALGGADSVQLVAEQAEGVLRLELRGDGDEGWTAARLAQLEADNDRLRGYLDAAPYPMWQLDAGGRLLWSNEPYRRLCETAFDAPFDPARVPFDIAACDAPGRKRQCLSLDRTGKTLWFDLFRTPREDGCLCWATDIDAVVSAEIAQRNFVQTLAKTFAQLSTGLAIFDRNRQLALFNPALIDLTTLPADFLSGRPDILSFFDRLRDNRIMPEPKDYGSWRQQMADLVEAASDGSYSETWSLASGSVYQVSGRPHPDGAVAFLFEDITAEITLTRRFRAELEQGQSVLNQLDDAIAVFSGSGVLCLTNAAYRQLWRVDPELSFAETTILDATRQWQGMCKATPILGEIRDFVETADARATWDATLSLRDGQRLSCVVHPVQNGATMVQFRALPDAPDAGQAAPRGRATAGSA